MSNVLRRDEKPRMVKELRLTLSDEEHEKAKEEKERRDMTWCEFLLAKVNGDTDE